jgi:hypothetical protein
MGHIVLVDNRIAGLISGLDLVCTPAWRQRDFSSLFELQSNESHCADRIAAAVQRLERAGHEVEGEQPAGAETEVVRDAKIANRTE